jgi:serine/threonine-protein kinase mTOR
MWWKRLQGGQRLVEDWQRILQVHSLVLAPHDDLHTWLKYASLCRKSGSLKLSHKTLTMLMGCDPTLNPDVDLPCHLPQVAFAYTKHLYVSGETQLAYNKLLRFVNAFTPVAMQNIAVDEMGNSKDESRRLLARCNMKLGTWQNRLYGLTETSTKGILACFEKATNGM